MNDAPPGLLTGAHPTPDSRPVALGANGVAPPRGPAGRGDGAARPVSIRARLLLLVLAALLPSLLGAAWLVAQTFRAEREAHERTLRETTRALSMVLDAELGQRATVARVLAQSRWLDDAPEVSATGLRHLEVVARRALQGMEGWVQLVGPERILLDTRLAPNAVPGSAQREGVGPLVASNQTWPLHIGADASQAFAAVVEPVERNGQVVLNLVVALRPAEVQRIVDRQQLPRGWFGAVIDSKGVVVARHPGGAAYMGRLATTDLRARIAARPEGFFESVSLDGQRTAGYHSTSSRGWTFVVAMPREQFAGYLPSSVLHVVLGSLGLTALAVLGALGVARRIVLPMGTLKLSAKRLQQGRTVEPLRTGLAECDEVVAALAVASRTLRHGRNELEHQVAQAVERTREAEQRVSQSQRVEALGRLTGGVAHDFNNLLGVISNSAHVIQRLAPAPEVQAPLAATLRAVEVGSRLTQHLLRFAGRRPVRPQAVELSRYLPELQELIRSVLGRHIEVSVHVAPGTHAVHVDASELELAMLNLALNARDAMPAGGEMRLRARNAAAEDLLGLPPREYVMISFSDEGAGMEPHLAARVFEPFFTTKAAGKGTGLGLSQVHGFCVQAGGAARLASTQGLGTTVTMLLPAAGSQGPLPAPAETVQATPVIAGARVLLVEDNHELGDMTAALLQSHGAQVERAADAGQALALLATQTRFDVVLSDVVMPGNMDGLALAQQLRRERPALPVVLISGYAAAEAAARDFVLLPKPCSPQELLAALHAALSAPPAPAPLPTARASETL
jgi:signal transduction histidine kinase/ActR/RegA family two-component response regulator